MTQAPYIAYIDIQAFKHLSKDDPENYGEVLALFRDALVDKFSQISERNNKVFFFCDSAYIQAEKIEDIFKYLTAIMIHLCETPPGAFIKGAVVQGSLNDVIHKHYEGRMNGISFSSKSVLDAFVLQDQLKGIGLTVAPYIYYEAAKEIREQYLIKNIYLDPMNTKTFHSYYDIKLEFDIAFCENPNSPEVCPLMTIINFLLQAAIESTVQGEKYDKYYFSIISNLLRSASFLKFKKFDSLPSVLTDFILLKGQYAELLKKMQWLINVPLIALEIFSDASDTSLSDYDPSKSNLFNSALTKMAMTENEPILSKLNSFASLDANIMPRRVKKKIVKYLYRDKSSKEKEK